MYYDNNDYLSIDDLLGVNEGFKKGNIFKNIYSPYNKYIYNFIPKNDREKLLIDIMKNSFYAHDLHLYLDNYPCDRARINLFNEYNKKSNELIKEYSIRYEPIIIDDSKEVPFSWVESPWPWEGV